VDSIVLDASVLIAMLNQEPGADKITPDLLGSSVSSTVNLAEVQSKLVDRGVRADDAWKATINSVNEAVPFTVEQAKAAGSLIAETRSFGLSLGDRACLSLAIALKAPVYTTDRSWKNLKLGIRIHVIR
jgi:PIN domain nuclease of toxin-antitoxin system